MGKFEELIQEGKLAETLMADKEFVEGAKKIFAQENQEIDDAKLLEIIKTVEENCIKEIESMNSAQLDQVSGGVRQNIGPDARQRAAGNIFAKYTVQNIVRYSLGSMGLALGAIAGESGGEYIAREAGADSPRDGKLVGLGAGAVAGAALGDRLGVWICKKAGIQ